MAVLIHVAIALLSLVGASLSYASPSRAKIQLSLLAILLTIASGTWLVIAHQANLLRTCFVGLIYVTIACYLTVLANRKLANF